MRTTPACTLSRLTDHQSLKFRRCAHVVTQYKKFAPKKPPKATSASASESAPAKATQDESKLTARQLKRAKYWGKATWKSLKDKAEHEPKALNLKNDTNVRSKPIKDAINIARLYIPSKPAFRKLAIESQKRLSVNELKTGSRSTQKSRKLKIRRIHVPQNQGRVRKLRAQRWWLGQKFKAFRPFKTLKAAGAWMNGDLKLHKFEQRNRLRQKAMYNMRAWIQRKQSVRVRKKASLRTRTKPSLLVQRISGRSRGKTTGASASRKAAVTGEWIPFLQRRRDRVNKLATALDQFVMDLGQADVSETLTKERLTDQEIGEAWAGPGAIQQKTSQTDTAIPGQGQSPLLRQLRLRSRAQQRSFSSTTSTEAPRAKDDAAEKETSQQATIVRSSEDLQVSSLPISPLELKLQQSRHRQTKRQPTRTEHDELASNPWAVMLAGSIRLDNASRIRMPTELLIDFGLVKSPLDQHVYPMPTELADLKAFADKLKSGKRLTKARLTNNVKGRRLRTSPYRLLIEEISDQFTYWDRKKRASQSKTSLVMRRMVPIRWDHLNSKYEAYQTASETYWAMREAKGELDNDVFKKPEAPFDLRSLQWQTAIADRMLGMMSQRILIALNHVGDMRKAQVGSYLMCKTCFDWPDKPSIRLDDTQQEFWNDMGDIESDDAISGTGKRQGNAKDPRPPIAVTPSEISELTPVQTANFTENPGWLPGSFFVHLGPAETTLKALPYISQSACPEPDTNADFQESKFITPMIIVAQGYRLPVFNLSAMLGPEFHSILIKILTRHKDTLLGDSEPIELDAMNHLILFRADRGKSNTGQLTLAHELWQLWRYVGGRDCLFAADAKDEPHTDENEAESDKVDLPKDEIADQEDTEAKQDKTQGEFRYMTRAQHALKERLAKNSSGYDGLSAAAWEHLYEILDLPPEESYNTERSASQ